MSCCTHDHHAPAGVATPCTGAKDVALMHRVVALAEANVKDGGRPFACIVADSKTGEVLAEAPNTVAQTGDPTAHAEMNVIKKASAILRSRNAPVDGVNGAPGEDYKGYTFYILTAPCAMCMAAMEYCGPDAVVFGTTREEYCAFYRDDRRHFAMETLYTEIAKPHAERRMPTRRLPEVNAEAVAVYRLWRERADAAKAGAAAPAAGPAGSAHTFAHPAVGDAAGKCPFATATAAALKEATAGSAASAATSASSATVAPAATHATTIVGAAAAAAPLPPYSLEAARAAMPDPVTGKLPVMVHPGRIDDRRPEISVNGQPVPAFGNPAELAALLSAPTREWPRLLEIVATRGGPLQAFFRSLRDLNTGMRENYAKMMREVGRNIFPLIVASDYLPGAEGIGSTFTLYTADGGVRQMAVCPPHYEMFKALSHMPLGFFTVVSPWFNAPRSGGWQGPLRAYLGRIEDAVGSLSALAADEPEALSAEVRAHAAAMLGKARAYAAACLAANEVTPEAYQAFTADILPLVQTSVMNAARLQVHAAVPALQRWKEELGPALWRDTFVLIPTVWPVSGRNPRQQIFEELLDADRVATHIIKAEGAANTEEARATLGRVVGDRTVAHMVFGTATPDARNLVAGLSTPRDIVSSACDDAIALHKAVVAAQAQAAGPAPAAGGAAAI